MVERLKIDVRKILGLLLSLLVLGEGGFLITYARNANIEGIGTILARTVQMAGAVVLLLGLLMFLYWLLKDFKFVQEKKLISKILFIISGIATAAVVVIALSTTMSARYVYFQNGYNFGRVAVAVICSQLVAISVVAMMLFLAGKKKVKNQLSFLAGILGCTGLVTFGAIIIGIASPMKADFLADIGPGKMTAFGMALIIIGAIGLVAWLMNDSKFMQKKRLIWNVIITALFAIVAIVAIYLSGVASDFVLGDFFVGKKIWFIGVAALLFLLAAVSMSAWLVRWKTLNKKFLLQAVGMLSGAVLATAGVVVFGFAGDTHVDGLGTLPHSLILMFGAQMILLGGMGSLSWVLKDTKYFDFGFRKTILDFMMLLLMSIAVIDGLCALMIAAPTDVSGIGNLLPRTLTLFGASVASLGIISLAAWTFRDNPAPGRLKRVEFLILLFWILMLVAGLLI